jgi:hypothetical protein
MPHDDSALHFRGVRNLHGEALPTDTYKRNGTLTLRYDLQGIETPLGHSSDGSWVLRVLSAGLNAVERRTWWRILDGWSIEAIADADGVTRAAIYCRIRGARGRGGMVSKNVWVAEWWNRRQHEHP